MKNKLFYVTGPLCLALAVFSLCKGIQRLTSSDLFAYTVPVTFIDQQILTAAQLNSVNDTAANAFNGHNHGGADGENSTLAMTAVSSSFTASGDITFDGATSSLECDGTTATEVFLDQGNNGVTVGGGDATSTEELMVRVNTGDPALTLRVGNSASTQWQVLVDNDDSDNLELDSAAVAGSEFGFTTLGAFWTDSKPTSAAAFETYTGTTCTPSPCNTTVDATAPGSGAPLSFSCMVSDGTDSTSTSELTEFTYLASADDLVIEVSGSTYANKAYKCVVWYVPE